jgi:hypothetical protein
METERQRRQGAVCNVLFRNLAGARRAQTPFDYLVMAGARGLLPRPADWKAASWLLSKGWPLEFGDRIAVETDPVPVSSMPPMNLILSMPDGTQRPTSFTEAEKILCAGFTRRDEPPEESEPGNSDGINIGPRFNP